MPKRPNRFGIERAEEIGIHGLQFLAGSPDRLGLFLSLSGLGPDELRRSAGAPAMLAAVLEHIIGDEPMLLELSANRNVPPDDIVLAWDLLTLEATGLGRTRP